MMSGSLYNVGKIVNTHGLKGDLKVFPTTDFPESRFKKGSELVLLNPDSAEQVAVVIEHAKEHKNTYMVKFKQFNDINDVEKFKGWLLKVSADKLDELPEDEYYYHEIIGCAVYTEDGEQLGTVSEILSPGANDVWVVQREQGKPVLIPYIHDVVKQVDVANKRITIELMEGLL